MAAGYIKRAFNRLFVVLSLGWVAYWTVIYPYGEQGKAFTRYLENERDCYESKLGQGKERLDECLKLAEKRWHRAQDQWALRNFLGPWILAKAIGLPLLVYGVWRGIAAVSLWIWRGYRAREALRKSET